ncbi:hypothetical protein PG996_011673 [Apiospora saccharicola]|uniref:S-adenosylmethionine-dependent methyltransferase-like protein n=1 Tax=Apiospora saccharicola TaxID=335842 RepID=A0ABR1UFQ3_9PEZI
MPSFGRLGKQSNRSQHNLVAEQQQQQQLQQQLQQAQQQQQQQPPPPPPLNTCHLVPQFQQHQQGPPPPLVQQQGQSPSYSGGNNNSSNPGQSTTTDPTALTSNHPAGHTSDPANTSAAFANNININHLQQQQFAPRPPPKSQNSQDFSEQVSRSQSTRYPQQVSTSIQSQLQFAAASSADDLSQTLSSPIISQGQHLGHPQQQQAIGAPFQQHHQQQQPPAAPTESKRSARKLIKKIVAGASSASGRSSNSNNHSSNPSSSDQHSYHQHHNSYDNSPGLGRKSSKRISSNFPPSIRTTGVSQSSIDLQQQQQQQQQQTPQLQPSDWPPQDQEQPPPPPPKPQQQQPPPSLGHQPVNPSPLSQGGGDSEQGYNRDHNNIAISPELQSAGADSSPYSANEDIAYQHQIRAQQLLQQAQAHVQADQQQQQSPQQQLYGRVVVDPAQDQYRQQYPPPPGQVQYQQGNPPPLYTTHLGAEAQHPNPETVSQLSHDSSITDTDARSSVIFNEQHTPALSYAQLDQRQVQPHASSSPASQSDNMPPPPGPPPSSTRRSGENEKNMRAAGQVEPPPGPPPGYRHSNSQGGSNLSSLPPTPGVPANVQAYRAEAGRNSPQPSNPERESDPEKQFKDLLTKYKNVKRLYFDGKAQIEQLNGQVEQLQNAVANQRISQSRTALDDNEYQTRFNRLNGAINNLSFNIRKDWKTVPSWIERYVSAEAIKTGKQEMTAVGRAVIIRWVVDEIFNKCFHPALEIELSQHLKRIEQNIRRFSYTLSAAEEYEALTSKVVSWRMATLEGLQQALNSPESGDHRQDFTTLTSTNLTAHLYQHMVEPPPPGVDGSVAMIVELAVGIAANLSLESRDVALVLPLPGDVIKADFMETEKQALPPLPDPEEGEESGKDNEKAAKREKTKSGMLTMLGSQQQPGSRKGSIVSNTDMAEPTAPPPPKDASKVRFAGFIAVEVRGRQVLVKAPVWTLG